MLPQRPPATRLAQLSLVLLLGALSLARYLPHTGLRETSPVPPAQPRPAAQATRLRDGEPIDINRASRADLQLLPGVGPAIAERVVEARPKAGFSKLEDLLAVKGIGEKTLEKLRPFVTIGSEELVNTAESELNVERADRSIRLQHDARAGVHPYDPAPAQQVVKADKQMAGGVRVKPIVPESVAHPNSAAHSKKGDPLQNVDQIGGFGTGRQGVSDLLFVDEEPVGRASSQHE